MARYLVNVQAHYPLATGDLVQFGCHFENSDPLADNPQPTAVAAEAAWRTAWNAQTAVELATWPADLIWSGVSVAGDLVDPAGVTPAWFQAFSPALSLGTGSQSLKQGAVVVTKVSAIPAGRQKPLLGRMFLPVMSGVGHGQLDAARQTTVLNLCKRFLDNMKTGGRQSVLKTKDKVIPGAANYTSILSLRVGNVVDTMRSRRNQVGETYATIALA